MWIQVTQPEFDTILAALRAYQQVEDGNWWEPGQLQAIRDIAEDHGPRLTSEEIDSLREAINGGEVNFTDEELMIMAESAMLVLEDAEMTETAADYLDLPSEYLQTLSAKIQGFLNPEQTCLISIAPSL